MKKKNDKDERPSVKRVLFHKTYIGKLGNYYKDTIYVLSYDLYMALKIDCKEI